MTAKALSSQQEFYIEILKGSDKGSKFKIISNKVTIGRSPDNDIVLNDPRVSRMHATLLYKNGHFVIEDYQSQNGIEVNGNQTRNASVTNGTRILIGDTHLVFKAISPENESGLENYKKKHAYAFENPSSNKNDNSSKSKIKFYMVVFSIALLFGFLLTGNDSNKSENEKFLSDQDIQTDIENSQQRQTELIKARAKAQKLTPQYMDAQASFLKGLRDYREGKFQRAISFFDGALALYPEHELANRYLRLSHKRLDEKIQYSLNQGQRYMDLNKYKMAMAAFREVMILVLDKNSTVYQEAHTKYNECKLLLQGAL